MNYLSLRASAGRLQVSESTVRNWFDKKIIRGVRLPSGVRRIPASEVERLEREMFAMPSSFPPNEVNASPKVTYHEVPHGRFPDF